MKGTDTKDGNVESGAMPLYRTIVGALRDEIMEEPEIGNIGIGNIGNTCTLCSICRACLARQDEDGRIQGGCLESSRDGAMGGSSDAENFKCHLRFPALFCIICGI